MKTNLTEQQLDFLNSCIDVETKNLSPQDIKEIIVSEIAQIAYEESGIDHDLVAALKDLKDIDSDFTDIYYAMMDSGFEFALDWNDSGYNVIYEPDFSNIHNLVKELDEERQDCFYSDFIEPTIESLSLDITHLMEQSNISYQDICDFADNYGESN